MNPLNYVIGILVGSLVVITGKILRSHCCPEGEVSGRRLRGAAPGGNDLGCALSFVAKRLRLLSLRHHLKLRNLGAASATMLAIAEH